MFSGGWWVRGKVRECDFCERVVPAAYYSRHQDGCRRGILERGRGPDGAERPWIDCPKLNW